MGRFLILLLLHHDVHVIIVFLHARVAILVEQLLLDWRHMEKQCFVLLIDFAQIRLRKFS